MLPDILLSVSGAFFNVHRRNGFNRLCVVVCPAHTLPLKDRAVHTAELGNLLRTRLPLHSDTEGSRTGCLVELVEGDGRNHLWAERRELDFNLFAIPLRHPVGRTVGRETALQDVAKGAALLVAD